MPHDEKCADLARHFLEADAPQGQVISLANRIQDAVEDWLRDHDAEMEEMERERLEEERRALENQAMEEHYRKHPHG